MANQPPDDLPRFSEADRRTLRWTALGLLAALIGIATLPWTLAVAERLDVVTVALILLLSGLAFAAAGGRRGRGWSSVRVSIFFLAAAALAGAAVFAACAASSCIR